MNYYEHHLGDYAKDAGHLSMLRDGAYRRLIDAYYSRERPLPPDVKECCELARCTTKAERDAVAYVLKRFFELRKDGYHQKRCDEEIERYVEKGPERDAKREAEKERQRRYRERRATLFAQLRDLGETPSFNASMSELENLLSRVTVTNGHGHITRDKRVTVTPALRDRDVTATASQSPVPSPQTPIPNPHPPSDPEGGGDLAKTRRGKPRYVTVNGVDLLDAHAPTTEELEARERQEAERARL